MCHIIDQFSNDPSGGEICPGRAKSGDCTAGNAAPTDTLLSNNYFQFAFRPVACCLAIVLENYNKGDYYMASIYSSEKELWEVMITVVRLDAQAVAVSRRWSTFVISQTSL